MRISFILSILLLGTQVYAQSPGDEQILGSPAGTRLNRWIDRTDISWYPSGYDITLDNNKPYAYAGRTAVKQIQTNFYKVQYIKEPAKRRWEVISRITVSEPPPGCVVSEQFLARPFQQ